MKTALQLVIISILYSFPLYGHGGGYSDIETRDINLFGNDPDIVLTEISMKNWNFSPRNIVLRKNQKNRLVFLIESGHHGVSIPGLKLQTGNLDHGEFVIWDIKDPAPGEYIFYCNIPCGEGHSQMQGKIRIM